LFRFSGRLCGVPAACSKQFVHLDAVTRVPLAPPHLLGVTQPATGKARSILDVGVPVLAGQLRTLLVGMGLDLIDATALSAARGLVALLADLALAAFAVSWRLPRRLVRPIGNSERQKAI